MGISRFYEIILLKKNHGISSCDYRPRPWRQSTGSWHSETLLAIPFEMSG
jgi:hypothetical protein